MIPPKFPKCKLLNHDRNLSGVARSSGREKCVICPVKDSMLTRVTASFPPKEESVMEMCIVESLSVGSLIQAGCKPGAWRFTRCRMLSMFMACDEFDGTASGAAMIFVGIGGGADAPVGCVDSMLAKTVCTTFSKGSGNAKYIALVPQIKIIGSAKIPTAEWASKLTRFQFALKLTVIRDTRLPARVDQMRKPVMPSVNKKSAPTPLIVRPVVPESRLKCKSRKISISEVFSPITSEVYGLTSATD